MRRGLPNLRPSNPDLGSSLSRGCGAGEKRGGRSGAGPLSFSGLAGRIGGGPRHRSDTVGSKEANSLMTYKMNTSNSVSKF